MSLERIIDISYTEVPDYILRSTNFTQSGRKNIRNLEVGQNGLAELLGTPDAPDVERYYKSDIGDTIYGKMLNKVLFWLPKKMPGKYVWFDLPKGAIAATIKYYDSKEKKEKIIMAYNSKYRDQLQQDESLRLYVNLHEQAHVLGVVKESLTDKAVGRAAYLASKWMKVRGYLGKKYQQALDMYRTGMKRAELQAQQGN